MQDLCICDARAILHPKRNREPAAVHADPQFGIVAFETGYSKAPCLIGLTPPHFAHWAAAPCGPQFAMVAFGIRISKSSLAHWAYSAAFRPQGGGCGPQFAMVAFGIRISKSFLAHWAYSAAFRPLGGGCVRPRTCAKGTLSLWNPFLPPFGRGT